ncbi:MAG: hypothetical protein DRO67_03030 [Candidatus Asgardarchaeum californiense]|nr:MAG: hypothetical protein DRO67_03030 [Candidatus Asgardarchaeum californiense]
MNKKIMTVAIFATILMGAGLVTAAEPDSIKARALTAFVSGISDQDTAPSSDTIYEGEIVGTWQQIGKSNESGSFTINYQKNGHKAIGSYVGQNVSGRIVGRYRHGYFNGIIMPINGTRARIPLVMLYRVENDTVSFRWMLPRSFGHGQGIIKS